MARLRLIHWNPVEGRKRLEVLRDAGHTVTCPAFDPRVLRALTRNPPDAVLIDLTRLPMQGRDVAVALRAAASRHTPIVFLDGDPAKVKAIRLQVPDAVYTTWRRVRSGVRDALAHPPVAPTVPESSLAGYSGTPLPKKLGIKPGFTVVLVGAPRGFEKTLGELPGVRFRRQARGANDLVIWFVTSTTELIERVHTLGALAGAAGVWIAWPKQSAVKQGLMASDLTQATVREVGLASGLVDYKICAIDEVWSGLKFARRKP